MILTLFDTPSVKTRFSSSMVQQAVTYLVKNTLDVVLNERQVKSIKDIRMYSSTPICKIFQSLVDADKLNCFTCLNLERSQSDIPEVLTVDDITIDGRVIPNIPVPTQLQKCWINLTPIASRSDLYNDSLRVSDTTTLASLFVRAALVCSYHDSDMWLSPKQAAMVIEFYSLTVTNVIGQAFNLDYTERQFVQTLFAMYFAQLLGGATTPLDVPPLLLRCNFLGSPADIMKRIEDIKPYRPDGGKSLMTPAVICNILQNIGPARMKRFTQVQLYRFLSASSIDSQVMIIAIDYPPYWVYQMLRVASGYKNPVISNVIKLMNLKPKLMQFADDLEVSNIITKKVNR